jgi:hypothetical protein
VPSIGDRIIDESARLVHLADALIVTDQDDANLGTELRAASKRLGKIADDLTRVIEDYRRDMDAIIGN